MLNILYVKEKLLCLQHCVCQQNLQSRFEWKITDYETVTLPSIVHHSQMERRTATSYKLQYWNTFQSIFFLFKRSLSDKRTYPVHNFIVLVHQAALFCDKTWFMLTARQILLSGVCRSQRCFNPVHLIGMGTNTHPNMQIRYYIATLH